MMDSPYVGEDPERDWAEEEYWRDRCPSCDSKHPRHELCPGVYQTRPKLRRRFNGYSGILLAQWMEGHGETCMPGVRTHDKRQWVAVGVWPRRRAPEQPRRVVVATLASWHTPAERTSVIPAGWVVSYEWERDLID